MLEPDVSVRRERFAELAASTPEGAARRKRFSAGVKGTESEFHGVGIEMNQRYASGAVYLDDESERLSLSEEVLKYDITTYPGSRLPHAWLNTRVPGTQISTIDLAGNAKFCLLTGIGGERWKHAAGVVGKDLGIEIAVFSIGWKQDYEDVYGDWAKRSGIEESGCVLVRPDRFVCWRAKEVVEDCETKLKVVLSRVLGHVK